MQCLYCQNWEISRLGTQGTIMTLDEVCDAIIDLLPMSEGNLGFVSPSHFVPQMVMIVYELHKRGHYPTIVYNTNGYDLPETIRSLEDIVDVWLPDFKYSDDDLAHELSDVPQYSKYALSSLKEMVHQVGTTLQTDDRGIARRGIILRHLVLPGFVENSIGVLKLISENLSPNLHISLMSQYYPPQSMDLSPPESGGVSRPPYGGSGGGGLSESEPETSKCCKAETLKPWNFEPRIATAGRARRRQTLNRPISSSEYNRVVSAFHDFGFTRGWLQDLKSQKNFRPDFSKDNPFNKEPQ
jgi:pyruvate-formate lyase-activating enzyme